MSVLSLGDVLGGTYYSFNVSEIVVPRFRPRNITGVCNSTTFLSESFAVRLQGSTLFHTDLTGRDDLLLAILSLLLVCLIEATLTTVLLRTHTGRVSNLSFSVKHFHELARDFRFRHLVVGRAGGGGGDGGVSRGRRVNVRVLVFAVLVLTFSLGMEMVLIFLTSPSAIEITNRTVSFSVEEVVLPDWNLIRTHLLSALTRPCNTLQLSGVDQGLTRITACLTSTGDVSLPETFLPPTVVSFNLTSDMHDFGGEHYMRIGNRSARFRTRVYFNLGDNMRKMLSKRMRFFQYEQRVLFMHRQYLAYLFSHYNRLNPAATLRGEALARVDASRTTRVEGGPETVLMKIGSLPRYRMVATRRYQTTGTGVLPGGAEALRFAGVVLKASTGVTVLGPDLNDLDMGSASTWPREALMWKESARDLNWLGLLVLAAVGAAVCVGLRSALQPLGTADIAASAVQREMGNREGLGPAWWEGDQLLDVAHLVEREKPESRAQRRAEDERKRESREYSDVSEEEWRRS